MYISVYPIAMSVRNTNVYEEQSLGLFGQDDVEDAKQGVELENNLTSGRHVREALLVIMDLDDLLRLFSGLGSVPRLSCSEATRVRYVVDLQCSDTHLYLRTTAPV